jgi:hypothetical protein
MYQVVLSQLLLLLLVLLVGLVPLCLLLWLYSNEDMCCVMHAAIRHMQQ